MDCLKDSIAFGKFFSPTLLSPLLFHALAFVFACSVCAFASSYFATASLYCFLRYAIFPRLYFATVFPGSVFNTSLYIFSASSYCCWRYASLALRNNILVL